MGVVQRTWTRNWGGSIYVYCAYWT